MVHSVIDLTFELFAVRVKIAVIVDGNADTTSTWNGDKSRWDAFKPVIAVREGLSGGFIKAFAGLSFLSVLMVTNLCISHIIGHQIMVVADSVTVNLNFFLFFIVG